MEMHLTIWDTKNIQSRVFIRALTLTNLTFDSCVSINQNYKSNLLEYENSQEIYSLGLGLVYKEVIVIQINNGNQNEITQGNEYIQELIEY